MSMCMVENETDKRYLYYQKYRDGLIPERRSYFDWDVDRGQIEEIDEAY